MYRSIFTSPRLCFLAWFLACPASLHAHGLNGLVFTKRTTHAAATAAGVTSINDLAVIHHFAVTQTADAATFIAALPTTRVVVFLNPVTVVRRDATSGKTLDVEVPFH